MWPNWSAMSVISFCVGGWEKLFSAQSFRMMKPRSLYCWYVASRPEALSRQAGHQKDPPTTNIALVAEIVGAYGIAELIG